MGKCEPVRQGDVYLAPIKSHDLKGFQPAPLDFNRIVLAHGEATGHAHAVLDQESAVLFDNGAGVQILKVEKETDLEHVLPSGAPTKEHGKIPLPKGLFRVVRQRQMTAGVARRVED